jgi:predicted DNA-binding transcriptional regulator YafY
MPKSQDTLLRLWHMLRHVPRYPRKITVQDMLDRLTRDGFEVDARTVQRSFKDLSKAFPLLSDERAKPFGWSWQKDAKSFDLPGLSIPEALTWVMAEQHLAHLLPASLLEHLAPQFRTAKERLDKEPQPHRTRHWLDKVRTAPPAQPLLPPLVNADIQRAVSDALLQEKQLEIGYRPRGAAEPLTYRVHPLAIVQRGPVVYLYGRLFDYPNTRILALHRIESARLLEDAAVPPEGFDVDDKVARGVWSFGPSEPIALRLRFYDGKGDHLLETPLLPDQKAEPVADVPGSLLVSATVPDTPQLRWWIQGFGDGVEVLEPAAMRQGLSEVADRMRRRYCNCA